MQLTFNDVEPHRVFYNDKLVKKIYMDDILVYNYWPNPVTIIPPQLSSEELNILNAQVKAYAPTQTEINFTKYATICKKFSHSISASGVYRITIYSPLYAGYEDYTLRNGDEIHFKIYFSTAYSIGECMYRQYIMGRMGGGYDSIGSVDVAGFDITRNGVVIIENNGVRYSDGFGYNFGVSAGNGSTLVTGHNTGKYALPLGGPFGSVSNSLITISPGPRRDSAIIDSNTGVITAIKAIIEARSIEE